MDVSTTFFVIRYPFSKVSPTKTSRRLHRERNSSTFSWRHSNLAENREARTGPINQPVNLPSERSAACDRPLAYWLVRSCFLKRAGVQGRTVDFLFFVTHVHYTLYKYINTPRARERERTRKLPTATTTKRKQQRRVYKHRLKINEIRNKRTKNKRGFSNAIITFLYFIFLFLFWCVCRFRERRIRPWNWPNQISYANAINMRDVSVGWPASTSRLETYTGHIKTNSAN